MEAEGFFRRKFANNRCCCNIGLALVVSKARLIALVGVCGGGRGDEMDVPGVRPLEHPCVLCCWPLLTLSCNNLTIPLVGVQGEG